MNIHKAASEGYQTGADSYERGRPEYPQAALDFLFTNLRLTPESTVLDLAAGTGKLTKSLIPTGSKVIAVEPVAGMRRKFISLLPNIEIHDGSAEALPLGRASVDAVVVGTAFHWFNGARALSEIHRVLKPGGRLGLIWNVRDESVGWMARVTEIIDRYENGAPRYRSGQWAQAFFTSADFTRLERSVFPNVQTGSYEMVIDRVRSISFISALPGDEREEVLRQVRELLMSSPETKDRQQIEFPYRTDVYWCESVGLRRT